VVGGAVVGEIDEVSHERRKAVVFASERAASLFAEETALSQMMGLYAYWLVCLATKLCAVGSAHCGMVVSLPRTTPRFARCGTRLSMVWCALRTNALGTSEI
ncbi:MAG: hypothetical protein IJ586_01925, partial [Alloprevotella sp.]|nr:hypothetical protein [Alloprevotella sp.]